MKQYRKIRQSFFLLMLLAALSLQMACQDAAAVSEIRNVRSVDAVPEYSGDPYVVVNDNEPEFSEEEITADSFESYSEQDALGRCGAAQASVGKDLMPTEERGSIGSVKPSGWQTVKYDFVDGKYLYNRCHLLGYQLTGENANERNLITGTRYMNVEGMLPFEEMIAEYVRDTGNHVMYRVTPVFEGDDLVAEGVQMEARSVEDEGKSICFNVYVYNVQPGVEIDYATGKNQELELVSESGKAGEEQYVVNKNTRKFHRPDCASVKDMKKANRIAYRGSRERLLESGYEPCGRCRP